MNRTAILCTTIVTLGLVAAVGLLSHPVTAGPLNPPAGAVASTYKTLNEVEPRIAINATNTPGDNDASPSLFKITQPGSYYLTGNITGVSGKHGIEIVASGVTLDLCGFDLVGVPGSLEGVSITSLTALTGVTVENGSVRNWGGLGVDYGTPPCGGGRVAGITASGNGGGGIRAGTTSTVADCAAEANIGAGINAFSGTTITGCAAARNTGNGIFCPSNGSVTNCSANQNTGSGVFAAGSGKVANCVSNENTNHGIEVGNNCVVTGCLSINNGFDGIRAASRCHIGGNTCNFNGSAGLFSGIFTNGIQCRIENNHLIGNDAGISVSGTGHFIVRNYAGSNTSNNYIAAPDVNFVGTIVVSGVAMNAAENSDVNISN